MNYIFVDNYRGFSNTTIPIRQVNFLVGENSTGKTSILSILKILTLPEFWLKTELDFRGVGFGTFKDIVSIDATDKSYFSIGIISDHLSRQIKKKEENSIKEADFNNAPFGALLMTFIEREGMPKLEGFILYQNGIETRVRYVGNNIKYKFNNFECNCSAKEFGKSIFSGINITKENISDYKNLLSSRKFINKIPPMLVLSLLQEEISLSKDIKNEKDKIIKTLHKFVEWNFFALNIVWLAPIRSKPRKTYDEFILEFSPEGDHTPYLIKKTMNSKSESTKFNEFLNDFGDKSGLFRYIEIKNYGNSEAEPFELDFILNKKPLSLNSVGYGISQVLPVIVEIFTRPKNSWFAIQQPEVHLHPKAQAALGELFFNLAMLEKKTFIIETHSDYTIDRFRISCKKSNDKLDSQILFFERSELGNKVISISIDEKGNLSSDQPESYREFFIKEEMDLLGL